MAICTSFSLLLLSHFSRVLFYRKIKPCPFGLRLRKFTLDPVIVIFFEMHLIQHLYIFFFWKWKKFNLEKKIQVWDQSTNLTPTGSSSYWKNLQRLDQPTLVIVLTLFEINYNDWIMCKHPKSKFKWTGLKYSNVDIFLPESDIANSRPF
jgi:hypothetical protein